MALACGACFLAAGCGGGEREAVGSYAFAVVGGSETPEQLGFSIDRFQRNAPVGQLVYGQQGCSGTIVGDRVVVSASHCVVMNQSAWLAGADPQVADPSIVKYAVGENVNHPDCLFGATSVMIPANAGATAAGAIAHDISVTILDKSVLETCPSVVPVQINRDPLGSDMLGAEMLQGGYGAHDYTYDFQPNRLWSSVQIWAIAKDYIAFGTTGHGGPTFGDSGSGCLYRFPDGSWRNLGVDSLGAGTQGTFVRLDAQGSFLDKNITMDQICGPVGPNGVCRDNAAVACGPNGFTSEDCSPKGMDCALGDEGKAGCVCACDQEAFCEDACKCDPQCAACACDLSAVCTSSCACDPDCDNQGTGGGTDGPKQESSGGCAVPAGGAGGALGWLLMLPMLVLARRSRRAGGIRLAPLLAGFFVAALASFGCSDGGGGGSGGSGGSTTSTTTSTQSTTTSSSTHIVLGTCAGLADLLDPTSCGEGQACDVVDFIASTVGCRPAGTTPAYAACTVSLPLCAAGSTCIGLSQDALACHPFCDTQAASETCPEDGVCLLSYPVVGGVSAGLCFKSDDCELTSASTCGAGSGCYAFDTSGKTFCLPAGTRSEGAACSDASECKPGLGCFSASCRRWCDPNTPCVEPATCKDAGELDGHPDLGHCE